MTVEMLPGQGLFGLRQEPAGRKLGGARTSLSPGPARSIPLLLFTMFSRVRFSRARAGALAFPGVLLLILSSGPRAEDCDGNGLEDGEEIAAAGPVILQGSTLRPIAPLESPVLAEADGDGALDLIAIADGEVVLHSGRGGRFPGPVLRSGWGAESILASADLEPDGDIDLAVALDSGVRFLVNDGRGSFSAGTFIPEGQFSGGALLDLDSDGRLDLVSIRRTRSGQPPEVVAIALEAAGPRITHARATLPDAIQVAAADIDGDSDRDLAALGARTLALHENAGGSLVRKGTLPFETALLADELETARIHAPLDDVVIHSNLEAYTLRGGGGWDQELRPLDTTGGYQVDAFADFDRDGLDDLVLNTYGGVVLARNTGSASFESFPSPACHPVSTGQSRRILDGDLDGDGVPDFILDFETDLTVFFAIPGGDADGNGRLDACDPDCNLDGVPDAVEVARDDCNGNGLPDACDPDCDADGIPDDCAIAIGMEEDCDGNSIPDVCDPWFVLGATDCLPGPNAADDCDGNGIHDADDVRPRAALWPLGLQRGELADLDGDGDLDLLGALDSGDIQFSRNLGKGVFSPEWRMRLSSGLRMSSSDIDGDGALDWISSADFGWPCNLTGREAVRTHVFLGDGNGGYRKRLVEDLSGCALVDLDGDGLPDLAGFRDGKLRIRLGRGDGTFRRSASLEVSGARIAAADLDGDGDPDLCTDLGQILLNGGAGRLLGGALLPPGLPEFGDFDGNGLLDLASPGGVRLQMPGGEFRAYLQFTPPLIAVETADIDGDGRIDLASIPPGGRSHRLHRNGEAGLSDPEEHGVGFEADGIAAADIDGDSFPELLLDWKNSEHRTAFRNDGRGGFAPTPVSPAGDVRSLAVADMDADGDRDIAALEYDEASSRSELRIFSNDGAGRLSPGEPFPPAGAAWSLLVSELDGDALSDVLVVGNGELGLLGNEGGSFSATWQASGHTGDVVLADLDGDGRTDIVAPPYIHGNMGGGAFLDRDFRPRYPFLAGVLDADGDADLELLVRDGHEVALLENDGAGVFGGARLVEVAVSTFAAAAGDWDGDGDPDVAVSGIFDPALPENASLRFRLNDGSGAFLQGSRFPRADYSLSAVDLDRDGRDELRHSSTGFLTLDRRGRLEGSAWTTGYHTASALGDLKGDPALELVLQDRTPAGWPGLIVLESFLSPSAADLDGDGVPDACAGAGFLRGDWNGDLVLGITDAIALLDHLFLGSEPSACLDAGDADDSGALELTDAVRVLLHLFLGGEPPPTPFPSCGMDATPDALDCGSPPCS